MSKKVEDEQDSWYGNDRRIGRIGKSNYITLPPEFLKKVKGKELRTFEVGNTLVLVPSETEPKIGELDFQTNDRQYLEYQIITAYLNNYRRIDFTIKEADESITDCIDVRLPRKLEGLSPGFGGEIAKREVKMSTIVEPIPNLLNKMHSSIKEIHKLNQKILSSLKAPTNIELVNLDTLENDIDKQSFLIKRLFCIVLTRLYLANQAGIEDLSQIIHYQSVNSNLERAGDLQYQITNELTRLVEKSKDIEKLKKMLQSENRNYSFLNYHKAAQEMLDDAYSGDRDKIIDIIKTKKQGSGFEPVRQRGAYISKEFGKTITDLTIAHTELTCLDFRIWGLTGSATNIAEAWLNMMGPRLKQKSSVELKKTSTGVKVPSEPPERR